MAGPLVLPDALPQPGGLISSLLDDLIVMDDIGAVGEIGGAASLLPRSRGAKDALNGWITLPVGGPEAIVLTGVATEAEQGLKSSSRRSSGRAAAVRKKAPGDEVFQALCNMMAGGARTILMTRWRTSGRTNFDLVKEFVQELPNGQATDAWQRAVLLARESQLDTGQEPRLKKSDDTSDMPKAEHPFFWAGYMLVDTGPRPEAKVTKEVEAPVKNAAPVKGAAKAAAPGDSKTPAAAAPANGQSNPATTGQLKRERRDRCRSRTPQRLRPKRKVCRHRRSKASLLSGKQDFRAEAQWPRRILPYCFALGDLCASARAIPFAWACHTAASRMLVLDERRIVDFVVNGYRSQLIVVGRLLRRAPQGREHQVADRGELAGQAVVEFEEQLVVRGDFPDAFGEVHIHQLFELLLAEFQAAPIEVLVAGHPAESGFAGAGRAADAFDDPLQHAEVLAVAGPEELAFGVAAEPVDFENARRLLELAAEIEPVAEVVAHVVAAERQHRERVAADLAELAERGGGHFRAHRGGEVYAERPIECCVTKGTAVLRRPPKMNAEIGTPLGSL